MNPALDPVSFQGPLLVTGVYFVLWYAMLFGLQSRTKYRLVREYTERGESFDRYFGQDRQMLAADRAVANTHEQMVPFLVSMWLHALVVSATSAAILGGVYVGLRAAYPFLLGKSVPGTQSKRVAFVTFPCYGIVFYLLGSSVFAAILH